jgi:hypothetical protein
MWIDGSMNRDVKYLMVGDDVNMIGGARAYRTETCSVAYFLVDDAYVIHGDGRCHCSCNYEVCCHVSKVVLEADSIEFCDGIGLSIMCSCLV